MTSAFHGRILGESVASGVRMTEACIEPGRRLPRHSHERGFFTLLLDGGYREEFGARDVACTPYTVAYHPPREPHECAMDARGARVFNVEIPDRWVGSTGSPRPFVDLRGGGVTWLATRLFREFRDGLAGPPIAAEGLLLEMLSLAGGSVPRRDSGRPGWLTRAIDFLESEFRRSLRIEEVAFEVGIHPTHLSRVFRRQLGVPLGEYVHRLRVRYASEELCRPEARLAEVAAAAGFADQSHMTRVFKRLTGATPAAFRRAATSQ
jgi:AraC family transcriptional regulator